LAAGTPELVGAAKPPQPATPSWSSPMTPTSRAWARGGGRPS